MQKTSALFAEEGRYPLPRSSPPHSTCERRRDTEDNAIALCPNCHRELHFGEQSRSA
ncbi:HNH endonuclease [Burkholderia plantarii]|nr:HNH endonuclease [Burkholderia plantarii]